MTPSSPLSLTVCRAGYACPAHAAALVALLDAYARDLHLYQRLGFAGFQLDPMTGEARFLQKMMV